MARTNAKRLSKAEWDQHREFVRLRYLVDRMTLEEVHKELHTERGFLVSLNQLEYRCKKIWGFSKYLDETTWQEIGAMRAFDGGGEGRHFFSRGRHLPQRKVNKEIKRRGLHQQASSSRTPLPKTAAASNQPIMGAASATTCLVSCPGTSDAQSSLPGAERKQHLAALYSVDSSERASLLSKIINKLIDNFNRSNGYERHKPNFGILVDKIADVIKLVKATTMGLDSLDTKLGAFQSTLLRLWDLAVHCVHLSTECSKDDGRCRFRQVVDWVLSAFADRNLLMPSISSAFFQMLRAGKTEVALLLWSFRTFDQSSRLAAPQDAFTPSISTFKHLVSVRTEKSALLLHEILRNGPVEWTSVIIRSSIQYSRTDDLKEILTIVAASSTPGGYNDLSGFWSSSLIRNVLTDCISVQPEQLALEKLKLFVKELQTLGLALIPSHVDSETFRVAARQGSLHLLKDLYAINPDLALRDRHGFSTLQVAADFGHLELCKWIFQNSPEAQQDADSVFLSFFIALARCHHEVCHFFEERFLAIQHRQFSVAEWHALLCFCNHSSTPNRKSPPFRIGRVNLSTDACRRCVLCTKAWQAAWMGCETMLRFHLDHGARGSFYPALGELRSSDQLFTCEPITTTSSLIPTYLRASKRGSLPDRMRCSELLIGTGIRPTRDNLATSMATGEWPMAQLLLRRGGLLEMPGTLLEAAICGQNEQSIMEVRQMTDWAYDPTALYTAVAFSSNSSLIRDIALELTSKRITSDLGSALESTAIALAAIQGDMGLFTRLLDAMPSPHQYTYYPRNQPFFFRNSTKFALEGFRECVRVSFLREQWYPWYRRYDKYPLLGLTALCDQPDITRTLLAHGLQSDTRACSMAVSFGSLATLDVFLRGQPPLREWTQPEEDSHDPLRAAIIDADDSNSDFSLISLILSAGSDINHWRTSTHLSQAVMFNNLRLVNFLLDQGADVNARCESNIMMPTALHLATHRSAEMVELLVTRGADVNAPPSGGGPTCLQLAAKRYDMLEIIISKEVKVDDDYRLDYIIAVFAAQFKGCTLVERRLQQYGGWCQKDEEILSIIRVLQNVRREMLLWGDIRDGVAHELAGRNAEAAGADGPEIYHDTTIPEMPGDSEISPTDRLISMSPWQHPRSSFGSMLSPHLFYDTGLGYVDITSPPRYLDEFDAWLSVSGPLFLRQEAEDIERTLDEEMPEFAW